MFHNFLNCIDLKHKHMKCTPEGKASDNWVNSCPSFAVRKDYTLTIFR